MYMSTEQGLQNLFPLGWSLKELISQHLAPGSLFLNCTPRPWTNYKMCKISVADGGISHTVPKTNLNLGLKNPACQGWSRYKGNIVHLYLWQTHISLDPPAPSGMYTVQYAEIQIIFGTVHAQLLNTAYCTELYVHTRIFLGSEFVYS